MLLSRSRQQHPSTSLSNIARLHIVSLINQPANRNLQHPSEQFAWQDWSRVGFPQPTIQLAAHEPGAVGSLQYSYVSHSSGTWVTPNPIPIPAPAVLKESSVSSAPGHGPVARASRSTVNIGAAMMLEAIESRRTTIVERILGYASRGLDGNSDGRLIKAEDDSCWMILPKDEFEGLIFIYAHRENSPPLPVEGSRLLLESLGRTNSIQNERNILLQNKNA